MTPYGVLILSTNQLLREGLKSGLKGSAVEVAGEGEDFISAASHAGASGLGPVVILINTKSYTLPRILREVGEARRSLAETKVVVLYDALAPEDVLRALQGGINALLSIDSSIATILGCLELVMDGHQVFPMLPVDLLSAAETLGQSGVRQLPRMSSLTPLVAPAAGVDNLVSFSQRAPGATAEVVPLKPLPPTFPDEETVTSSLVLSDREEQVLRCLVNGHPNKIIARELGIAETTVKVHVKSVLRKVGASNRTQAAIWALHQRSLQADHDIDHDVSGLLASKLQAG